jgi:hypothetical protein
VLVLDNGAQSHQIVKVPIEDLAHWDATHDVVGRLLQGYRSDSKDSTHAEKGGVGVGVISQDGL